MESRQTHTHKEREIKIEQVMKNKLNEKKEKESKQTER